MSVILWRGAVGRRSQLFGQSVFRGAGRRRSIALTFDDGPSPGSVALANYLAVEGVTATFFLCGANVLRHPEIVRSLAQAGHELGNHTFSHKRLCPRMSWRVNLLSKRDVFEELANAQTAIESVAGVRPSLWRAPYGLRWYGVRDAQRKLGLLGVMWTVIGHDWEWSSQRIARHVLAKASAGGILCLHDGRDIRKNPDIGETLDAVHRIVPELKRRGFRFETVSELLRSDAEAAC